MRTLSMMTAGIVVLLTSPGLAGERSELGEGCNQSRERLCCSSGAQ